MRLISSLPNQESSSPSRLSFHAAAATAESGNGNVIELSRYRSRFPRKNPKAPAVNDDKQMASNGVDDYPARMQANAIVFLISTVLIMTGIWLMNGLAATYHHLS